MFKNPPGDYAGRLIEAAGLQGERAGGAEISSLHANFFVNTGGATAADVMDLINRARYEVMLQFGVALELEIEVKDYEAWEQTVVFNPDWAGLTVSPSNIMAQAVLFNAAGIGPGDHEGH